MGTEQLIALGAEPELFERRRTECAERYQELKESFLPLRAAYFEHLAVLREDYRTSHPEKAAKGDKTTVGPFLATNLGFVLRVEWRRYLRAIDLNAKIKGADRNLVPKTVLIKPRRKPGVRERYFVRSQFRSAGCLECEIDLIFRFESVFEDFMRMSWKLDEQSKDHDFYGALLVPAPPQATGNLFHRPPPQSRKAALAEAVV